MGLGALATYIPENSHGGTRYVVKTMGGELQSDSEGDTDSPYDDGGEAFGWDDDCDELSDGEDICLG